MANADAPRGLAPYGYRNGKPYTGAANKYHVPASDETALLINDPVKLAGSADATGRYATVTRAAAGDPILGVVVGIDAPLADSTIYRVASVATYVLIADDPDLIFEIQEDSAGGALTANSVGLNADLVAGTGSTFTGMSGFELDSSTADTTASLDFQIIGLSPREDNVLGTNAKWLVKPNNHARAAAATGV
jgi:hypothetical protein